MCLFAVERDLGAHAERGLDEQPVKLRGHEMTRV